MSHEATNWAFQQKGLNPATKILLLQLADRHNPDLGCFPSLKRLCIDCEMTKPTVIKHLNILRDRNLITINAAYNTKGGQTSNRYILHFENSSKENLPPPVKKIIHPPVKKIDTNLVSINHVNNKYHRYIGSDVSFEDIWKKYPVKKAKGSAKTSWSKAIKKIQQKELIDKLIDYIESVRTKDKKFIPHLSTWLNQERWDDELDNPDGNIDQGFRDMVQEIARTI